jgi:phosphoribosylaminoimidazole-succinocarboxamide synthase
MLPLPGYACEMEPALTRTDLPFPVRRGKVRDVYDLGDALLIVATDRISAFDVVLPNGIPEKGQILTQLARFWFDFLHEIPNHLLDAQPELHDSRLRPFAAQLRHRAMLVRKSTVVPFECVARGYLAGSGWNEYQASGQVCGVRLPPGLVQCQQLPQPIFTPATKAEHGHDQNVSFEVMREALGTGMADRLRELTLLIYARAADHARGRGVIIADTKLEFGVLPGGELLLIDEVLTPDSSRFWPVEGYEPGRDQPSFDKQYVRNWLLEQPWDRTPPAPALPEHIIEGTHRRYVEAFELLTGRRWQEKS